MVETLTFYLVLIRTMGLWQIAFWDWKKSQRQRVREGSVLLTKHCWGRKRSPRVKSGQILGEQRVDSSTYCVHHWTAQIWTGSDPSCGWVKTVRLAQMTNCLVIWHNEWVLGLYAVSLALTNNVHSLCWFTDPHHQLPVRSSDSKDQLISPILGSLQLFGYTNEY